MDEQLRLLEEDKKDFAREFYGNEKRRIQEKGEELKLKRTKILFRISAITEKLCNKDVHCVDEAYFDAKKNLSDFGRTYSKGKDYYDVYYCRFCGKVTRVIENRLRRSYTIWDRKNLVHEYDEHDLPERCFSDFASYKPSDINFARVYRHICEYFEKDYSFGIFINLEQNDVRDLLLSLKEALDEKTSVEEELAKNQEALDELCKLFGHDLDEEVVINDQSGTCKCCGKTIQASEYIKQCQYAQYINLLDK
ncbi:MAG: hypothetical protein IJS47_04645 [Clostridia bacterium]|nr:hypothetical protein [Clostridia bacterium]